jgi:hypothetical protein
MRHDRPTDERSFLADKAVPVETSEQLKPPRPVVGQKSPQPSVAHSLEEAKRAIVKFVMPLGIGNLTQYGTGFLVDGRGWIATNNHVITCITTEARVKLANGEELELEGIAARLPRHDLAIVKLKNPPSDLMLLDIGYDGRVPLGTEVFAFGHPYDAEFSLSKGIVSRVLTTKEWASGSKRHSVARLRAPDEMIWIQHDAKISPGNSGGPLIDENARVFGLNTFVHLRAEFGYASHVRYLRELVGSVSDQLEPLPDARRTVQTAVSSRRILELFGAASQFEWHPRTPEQYDDLAELAKQMTLAKHALLAGGTSKLQSNVIHRVAAVADQRFTALRELTWSDGRLNALNSFADGKLSNAGDGVLAYGVVLGKVRNQNTLLMRIDGTGSLIVLSGGSQLARMPRNSKLLVLGFVIPRLAKIQNATRTVDQQAPVVLTHYLLPVERKK